jgi:hypothetical protein
MSSQDSIDLAFSRHSCRSADAPCSVEIPDAPIGTPRSSAAVEFGE